MSICVYAFMHQTHVLLLIKLPAMDLIQIGAGKVAARSGGTMYGHIGKLTT